jgi:hypothetical protein
MTLLEGHADVIMDEAGPSVIPTLTQIRKSFNERRKERVNGLKALPAKLIGMDAKMAQYTDGARFCRSVLKSSGMETLNLVFKSEENMPTLSELDAPDTWLRRMSSQLPQAQCDYTPERVIQDAGEQDSSNPYDNPYANPYDNPYANPYDNPYGNPYRPTQATRALESDT